MIMSRFWKSRNEFERGIIFDVILLQCNNFRRKKLIF